MILESSWNVLEGMCRVTQQRSRISGTWDQSCLPALTPGFRMKISLGVILVWSQEDGEVGKELARQA